LVRGAEEESKTCINRSSRSYAIAITQWQFIITVVHAKESRQHSFSKAEPPFIHSA